MAWISTTISFITIKVYWTSNRVHDLRHLASHWFGRHNAQSMCCFNATTIHIKTTDWTIYLAHKLMPIAFYGLKNDLLGIHNIWEKCQPTTASARNMWWAQKWLLGHSKNRLCWQNTIPASMHHKTDIIRYIHSNTNATTPEQYKIKYKLLSLVA